MKKLMNGFTLAEVLITLGIIGVIAAIVMPAVMTNYTYKTVGVKLGKFMSQLEGSTRPFVVQNQGFSAKDNYANVNAYLEESFLIKNITDIKEQEFVTGKDDKGNDIKAKIKSLVYMSGAVPTRGSSDTGFTSSGKFSDTETNRLDLKDGTSMVVYPLADYTEQAEIDPYKVGEVVYGITFSPNVKGLPNTAQQTYDFVITDLGYVYPNSNNDKCMQFIYSNDFETNASSYKKGTACAASTTK